MKQPETQRDQLIHHVCFIFPAIGLFASIVWLTLQFIFLA